MMPQNQTMYQQGYNPMYPQGGYGQPMNDFGGMPGMQNPYQPVQPQPIMPTHGIRPELWWDAPTAASAAGTARRAADDAAASNAAMQPKAHPNLQASASQRARCRARRSSAYRPSCADPLKSNRQRLIAPYKSTRFPFSESGFAVCLKTNIKKPGTCQASPHTSAISLLARCFSPAKHCLDFFATPSTPRP